MGVVGELRRVAGADVVAAAGVDEVVAGLALGRGLVIGVSRFDLRPVLAEHRIVGVGLDRQRIAGEQVGASAGIDRVVAGAPTLVGIVVVFRSEEHTSELQSLMRISYAVFCLINQHSYYI